MVQQVMPPLSPDPDAIDHLEGNERVLREYRERAIADRRKAEREKQ
ncbi:MAG TPA: hypothetical protein VHB02_05085 [Acidimicrobiales bacterium]|nr:hypothetical protein [Acidimicrobiales bacterium]